MCLTKSEVKDYVRHIVNQAQAASKKRNSFQAYCDIVNQYVDIEELARFVGAAFWSQASEDQKDLFVAALHPYLAMLMAKAFHPFIHHKFKMKMFNFSHNDDTRFSVTVEFKPHELVHKFVLFASEKTGLLQITVDKTAPDPGTEEVRPHFLINNLIIPPDVFNTRLRLQKHYTKTFNQSTADSHLNKVEDVIADIERASKHTCQ